MRPIPPWPGTTRRGFRTPGPRLGTGTAYPVPLELTPENAEAVARFLGDAVNREPALMLEYFCRCAREETKRVPPRTFCSPHRLTEDDFGLLNYALVEMQRLCLDVPPVPPNAYMPYYLREYVTRLVNGFKPLVSRSARLYRILGFWCTCGSGPGRPPLRSGCDPRKWPWTLA